MFLVMTVLPAKAVQDRALILYFPFDEQLDGRKAEDMTGNGNNAQLKWGAKITDEAVYKGAGALKIDNISAVVQVEPFAEMNKYQENTFVFWIYFLQGATGRESSILTKNSFEDPADGGVHANINSPGVRIKADSLSMSYQFNPGIQGAATVGPDGDNSEFEQKTWYHIAGVRLGAALRIYINGKEKGKYRVPQKISQGEGRLRIGGTQNPAFFFIMDEFAIYNRALTDREVDLDAQGKFMAVEAPGKLATTWSRIKTGY
jgi:hypothetical protein